jgi:glycosyltransferase involved in cell wall biosynthesis
VPWPRAFDAARRREREWLSYIRSAHKLMPRYAAARRSAAALIIGSRDTWRQMPAKYQHKCVYIPENAIDPARFTRRRDRSVQRPLRLAFLGRLVPYKGADMALEAARPLLERGDVTFDIWGEGPLRPELETLAEGIPGVRLGGWVEHTKVQDVLADADVLVFPSIREFGGGVALEAMAVGTPAMVVDYGGPAELVTAETGWLVPLGSRGQIIEQLRAALEQLVGAPLEIDEKGRRALDRVNGKFTWPVKARQSRRVYDWVLGRAQRPDFEVPADFQRQGQEHRADGPNAAEAAGRC